MQSIYLTIALAPLAAAIAAGLFGRVIGRVGRAQRHHRGRGAVLRACRCTCCTRLVFARHGARSTARSTPGWSATA